LEQKQPSRNGLHAAATSATPFPTWSGPTARSFAQVNLPTVQNSGFDWDTRHLAASSDDPLSGTIIFIPEPSNGALLLGASAFLRRRRARPV
jgi:hypothetical protein